MGDFSLTTFSSKGKLN